MIKQKKSNTPYDKIVFLRHLDGRVVFVGRHQPQATGVWVEFHPLQREFPINVGHHDVTLLRVDGLVNHQQVAIVDAAILHRITYGTGIERGGGMTHQLAVQVDALRHVVLCR